MSHSGNYDTITIHNCGIGEKQGGKIVELLNRVLANQEKLDDLIKVASQPRQITVVQSPVAQSNSGGCNQQVVGGNNNTNNCVPQPRILTKEQAIALADAITQVPSGIQVKIGAADSGEAYDYADQIRAC